MVILKYMWEETAVVSGNLRGVYKSNLHFYVYTAIISVIHVIIWQPLYDYDAINTPNAWSVLWLYLIPNDYVFCLLIGVLEML